MAILGRSAPSRRPTLMNLPQIPVEFGDDRGRPDGVFVRNVIFCLLPLTSTMAVTRRSSSGYTSAVCEPVSRIVSSAMMFPRSLSPGTADTATARIPAFDGTPVGLWHNLRGFIRWKPFGRDRRKARHAQRRGKTGVCPERLRAAEMPVADSKVSAKREGFPDKTARWGCFTAPARCATWRVL